MNTPFSLCSHIVSTTQPPIAQRIANKQGTIALARLNNTFPLASVAGLIHVKIQFKIHDWMAKLKMLPCTLQLRTNPDDNMKTIGPSMAFAVGMIFVP
jgi:hypothetical protein